MCRCCQRLNMKNIRANPNVGTQHRKMENDSEQCIVSAPQRFPAELRDQVSMQSWVLGRRSLMKEASVTRVRHHYVFLATRSSVEILHRVHS